MQEPAAPSAAPQPPPAVPGAAAVTGAAATEAAVLEGLPRTAQEVQGLRARREILRDQLNRATDRRDQLVSQLNRDMAPEARTGVHQRLILVDERILQLERDQALTEQLLSNASPEVLAMTTQPSNTGGMVTDDEAAFAAFGMFALGIVVAVLVGRFRRRRHRRRGGAPALLPEDPRLERLTQAVDAIAEEVERIGEGQRFVTRLLAEPRTRPAVKEEVERG